MAELRYPLTDQNRLRVLEASVDQTAQDRLLARPYVVPTQMETMIQTFLAKFRPAYDHMLAERGTRGKEVDEKNTAVSELAQYVRDFLEVLQRRIAREKQPQALFIEYGQIRSGENATGQSAADVIDYADQIIKGEVRVIADGYAPMTNPTVAEIETRRTAAIAEIADVNAAKSNLDQAQHDLDALRPEADKLIRIMNSQLNITLYGMSKDDTRAVKERYGFTFYDRETASTGDEETPAPITPEPTT